MKKNEPSSAKRLVGPIAFFDNDGNYLNGLDFKTALGQVFTSGAGADWVAAATDVVTQAGLYYYAFSQSETNFDSIIAVKLARGGKTGTSTAVAANSLSDSTTPVLANKYNGQVLVDSASTRWPIVSHGTTTYTLGGTGTPAAGAYVIEGYKDIWWTERTDTPDGGDISSLSLAQLGIQLVTGETAGSPTFSRTVYTISSTDSPSTVNDFYNGCLVQIYDDTTATNIGATAVVDDYNGATKQLTLVGTGFAITPTAASKLSIARGVRIPNNEAVRANWESDGAIIEGAYRAADLMRLMASILGGKVTDFQTGTLVFRDLGNTKTRWTVVTDPSGRISITPGDVTP